MKKNILAIILISLLMTLTSCGGESNNKKISIDEAIDKQMELIEKVQNGEITEEQAAEESKKIKDNTETKEDYSKRENNNISSFEGMPNWAIKAGIIEPNGLKIVENESSITEYDADKYMTDAVNAVYSGDTTKILTEAKRITNELNLTIGIDKDGIFNADGTISDDYSVYIYTEGSNNEKLVISVSNNKQLEDFSVKRK